MTPRPMTAADLDWVLELNREHETELSPLTSGRLAELHETAFTARVVDPEAAFLLTFDQNADYDSPNFLWFRGRYPRFAYVDRIAVSLRHRRKGLAGALYEDAIQSARAADQRFLCCEVNSDPPNPGSDAFHAALGFDVLGEAFLDDRGKSVRYLALALG